MNAKFLLPFAFFAIMDSAAFAQGFAGLGSNADGFALPQRGKVLTFPEDHGAHPDFRIEWWYLTATLTAEDGFSYGVQWTLFRSALDHQNNNGWDSSQIWMGHAAVTTPTQHLFDERFARGGIGQAGVVADPFLAWIDNWEMAGDQSGGLSDLTLRANGTRFGYALELSATHPMVLHGDAGFSVKSHEGQASHYYSQPSYSVSGTLELPNGPVEVVGEGWLDREWSSQPLTADQTGWDWFSLSFDSGEKLMGYRLRDDGDGYTFATWIDPKGNSHALDEGSLAVEPLIHAPVFDREIPIKWRLSLDQENLDIEVTALNANSWMGTTFPYWEGPVSVAGTHSGRGYLEMTGYE